jgi:hypothetical protein
VSYELQAQLTNLFANDSVIKPLLGVTISGGEGLGVYPYHYRDVQNPAYPLITIARFGSAIDSSRFNDSDFANRMDAPRIAIDVYAKHKIGECWAIFEQVRVLLKSRNTQQLGSANFKAYALRETLVRDDLFDEDTNVFRLHSEHVGWVQVNTPLVPN